MDCSDGKDELDCKENPVEYEDCNLDEFMCNDDSCIPMKNVCDGFKDCPNGEEEDSCPTPSTTSTTTSTTTTEGLCSSYCSLKKSQTFFLNS